MPIVTNCPNCRSLFNLADDLAGATVKCQSCEHVFEVPQASTVPAPPSEDEPVLARIVDKPPVKKPAAKSPKARPPAAKKSGSSVGILALLVVLLGGGLLGCVGCLGGVGWWFYAESDKEKPGPGPLAVANDKQVAKPPKYKTDDKKDDGKKDDGDKDKGIKDKKVEPPPISTDIKLAFGPDGRVRIDSAITSDDPRQPLDKVGKSFLLEMDAGKFYQIDMLSDDVDAYVHLIELPNAVVATDNDSGGGRNARIMYKPLRSGTFLIRATTPTGNRVGKFTLIVRRSDDAVAIDPLGAPQVITRDDISARVFTFNQAEAPLANLVWARDGKSFYVLNQKGRIQRINADTGKIDSEHSLGRELRDPANLALSGEGLLVSLPDEEQIWIIDPNDLSLVKRKIAVPKVARVVAGIDARVAVASFRNFDKGGLKVIDLVNGEIKQSFDFGQVQRALAASPDGKHIFASDMNEANRFARYRLEGHALLFQQTSAPLERLGDAINVTPDGQRVWLPGRTLGAVPEASRSYLYSIDNQRDPVLTLAISQFAYAAALDLKSGCIFSHDPNKALVVFSANGIRRAELDLPGIEPASVREIAVSPLGHELLIRSLEGVAHVKLNDKGFQVIKIDPPPKKDDFKSVINKTDKQGGLLIHELNVAPLGKVAKKGFASLTYPCWDAKGKYLYFLQDTTTLLKISRDFKLEATVNLPGQCRFLAMSAEGLVTHSIVDSQIWVIDPDTLKVRNKIPSQSARFVGASPSSSVVVIQALQLLLVDLKAGKTVEVPIVNAPANFTGPKSLALSPDGKTICAQATDYSYHRLRVESDRIVHEASRQAPIEKLVVYFQFSPDSKHMAMTYPIASAAANMIKTTEVFAVQNWNDPVYSIPTRLYSVAFDDEGRLYAASPTGDIRLYPNPAKMSETFQSYMTSVATRRLLASPQGSGCLAFPLSGIPYWFEPAPKN